MSVAKWTSAQSKKSWVAGVIDATGALLLRVNPKTGLPFAAMVRVRASGELQRELCEATGLGFGREGYWNVLAAEQQEFLEGLIPFLRTGEIRDLAERIVKYRRTQVVVRSSKPGTVLPQQVERFRRRLVAGGALHRRLGEEVEKLAPSLRAQLKGKGEK